MSTVSSEYGANQITVLEGLEPVRKRPGMYIGSTGPKGLHHLVFEVVDNSIDEALAGHCEDIIISLHKDGSCSVHDNGRGIPCEIHPTTKKSSLETVLTVLHAGGKFGGDSGYKVSGGLHGVGLSVVNALSEWLEVTVCRDGNNHKLRFERGKTVGEMAVSPALETDSNGTFVHFMPDAKIFKTTCQFEFDKLSGRMDELAYLNAGVKLTLQDFRDPATLQHDSPTTSQKEELSEIQQPHKLAPTPEEAQDVQPAENSPFRTQLFFHEGGLKEFVEIFVRKS